jgi:hypothetical protein
MPSVPSSKGSTNAAGQRLLTLVIEPLDVLEEVLEDVLDEVDEPELESAGPPPLPAHEANMTTITSGREIRKKDIMFRLIYGR